MNAASLFMVEWLIQHKTTENLHKVAATWNWDYGTEILRWIIEQPECDRSTAKVIFLLAAPDDLLRFSSYENVFPMQKDDFLLTIRIAELWNSGFYKVSKVRFDPAVEGIEAYRRTEANYRKEDLPWLLSPDFDAVEGNHDLDTSDFAQGFNEEMSEKLKAIFVPTPNNPFPRITDPKQ